MNEATEWLIRCSIDDCKAQDIRALEAWLKSDEAHQVAYELADLNWQKFGQVPHSQLSQAWFDRRSASSSTSVLVDSVVTWRRPGFWSGVTSATAVFLLALIVVLVRDDQAVTAYSTGIAETNDVTLEDGTVMTLGAKTSVDVTFTKTSREVALSRGEVFFTVVSNPDRPFIVSSAGMSITVVGTIFEVSRADASVGVAVVEGAVDVAAIAKSVNSDALRLMKGQRVNAVQGVLSAVEPVALESIGTWREGELAYVNAPLSEIISDADRYYAGDVVLMDASLADLTVSLILDAGDIDGLLKTLETALPIRVSYLTDGTVLITRPHEE
ncbi:MAG: FecR domain-containing protein [Pseudomonadota bacterium]